MPARCSALTVLPPSSLRFFSIWFAGSAGMPLTTRDLEWTAQMDAASVWTSVAPTIAAVVTNLIVLGFAVAIIRNPKIRSLLRRQSLLMLLSVQVASVFQGAAYILESFSTEPSKWCTASVNIGFLTVGFINFIVTLIGINLCISVAYNVHTSGWTAYYIGGSFMASFIIMIPGAIRGAWGWDELGQECYVALQRPDERFAWQAGTIYVWLISCCLASFTSTALVLGKLIVSRSRTRRLFTSSQGASNDHLVRHVAVRIVWYPIILILCTIPQITSDFVNDKNGDIQNMTAYVLWILAGFTYAIMPLLLAVVAIFVDPSFSRAVRTIVLRREELIPSVPSTGFGTPHGSTLAFASQHPEDIKMSALNAGAPYDGDSAHMEYYPEDGKDGTPFDGRDVEALPTMNAAVSPLQERLQERMQARAAANNQAQDLRLSAL